MHMQVITFKLDGIDDAAYRAHAEQNAPVFTALPGLRAKIWLANQQANIYGGIYTWDDVAAMRAYQGGKIFQGLQANPGGAAARRMGLRLERRQQRRRGRDQRPAPQTR